MSAIIYCETYEDFYSYEETYTLFNLNEFMRSMNRWCEDNNISIDSVDLHGIMLEITFVLQLRESSLEIGQPKMFIHTKYEDAEALEDIIDLSTER